MTQTENYQPQVRDTTNGPNIHTYIPRVDGTVLIGGVVYVPQTTAEASTATTATATATAQLYTIPPGGPAVPAFNVLTAPRYYPDFKCCPVSHYLTAQQVPQQQMVYPQPVYQQPLYPQSIAALQPYQTYPQYTIHPEPSTNGLPTFHINQPAHHTIGLTGTELLNQQLATAQGLEMNKKQEMKPADDDPMRMYWVREFDGTYTQRNRLTIDSGDIGECRWYAQDGVFYAVRLQ